MMSGVQGAGCRVQGGISTVHPAPCTLHDFGIASAS